MFPKCAIISYKKTNLIFISIQKYRIKKKSLGSATSMIGMARENLTCTTSWTSSTP